AHGGLAVWTRFITERGLREQLRAVLPHRPTSPNAYDPCDTALGLLEAFSVAPTSWRGWRIWRMTRRWRRCWVSRRCRANPRFRASLPGVGAGRPSRFPTCIAGHWRDYPAAPKA